MEVVLKEAGYLLSYLFSELDNFQEAYPIFCQIDKKGLKKTKEFHKDLENSVKEVITLINNLDINLLYGAFSIFPVEVKNDALQKDYNALMTIIKKDDIEIQLLQKYDFDESNKLIVDKYKIIYAENIDSNYLKELEKYYILGLLEYKKSQYIWKRSSLIF